MDHPKGVIAANAPGAGHSTHRTQDEIRRSLKRTMSDTSRGTPHPMSAPAEPDALAATKFTPPRVPVGWVHRPRLDMRLEAGLQGPLTLLAAGAGAGKSAMLGAWAAQRECSGPVAWLSLDAADRDRRRFWRGVLARARRRAARPRRGRRSRSTRRARRPARPRAGQRARGARGAGRAGARRPPRGRATAACSPTSTGSLRHPPAALRLVISTRVDPPLAGGPAAARRRADRDPRGRPRVHRARGAALLDARRASTSRPTTCGSCGAAPRAGPPGLRLAALTLRTHADPPPLRRRVRRRRRGDGGLPPQRGARAAARGARRLPPAHLGRRRRVRRAGGRADRRRAGPTRCWRGWSASTRSSRRSATSGRGTAITRCCASCCAPSCASARPERGARAAPARRPRGTSPSGSRPRRCATPPRRATGTRSPSSPGAHWVPLLVQGELSTAPDRTREPAARRAQDDPEVALALSAVLLDRGDERGRRRAAHARPGRPREGAGGAPARVRPRHRGRRACSGRACAATWTSPSPRRAACSASRAAAVAGLQPGALRPARARARQPRDRRAVDR